MNIKKDQMAKVQFSSKACANVNQTWEIYFPRSVLTDKSETGSIGFCIGVEMAKTGCPKSQIWPKFLLQQLLFSDTGMVTLHNFGQQFPINKVQTYSIKKFQLQNLRR
jgi:hypothetical protein